MCVPVMSAWVVLRGSREKESPGPHGFGFQQAHDFLPRGMVIMVSFCAGSSEIYPRNSPDSLSPFFNEIPSGVYFLLDVVHHFMTDQDQFVCLFFGHVQCLVWLSLRSGDVTQVTR